MKKGLRKVLATLTLSAMMLNIMPLNVFAATTADKALKVSVTNVDNTVTVGKKAMPLGKVTDGNGLAVANAVVTLSADNGASEVTAETVGDGSFIIPQQTFGLGEYTFTATKAGMEEVTDYDVTSTYKFDNLQFSKASGTAKINEAVTLSGTAKQLDPADNTKEIVVSSGSVGFAATDIDTKGEYSAVATQGAISINPDGTFLGYVPTQNATKLYYGPFNSAQDKVYKAGEYDVLGDALKVKATVNGTVDASLKGGNQNNNLKLEADLPNNTNAGANVKYTISGVNIVTDGSLDIVSGDFITAETTTVDSKTVLTKLVVSGDDIQLDNLKFNGAGNLTVAVEKETKGNSVTDYTASKTLVVAAADKVNVFPSYTKDFPVASAENLSVTVVDQNGDAVTNSSIATKIKKAVVSISGPITAPSTKEQTITDGNIVVFNGVNAEMGGDITVKVVATMGDNTEVTKEVKIPVAGLVVDYSSLGSLEYGKSVTAPAIIVKTAAGVAINNAKVTLNATILTDANLDGTIAANEGAGTTAIVDGTKTNINNGTYTLPTLKYNAVGALQLLVEVNGVKADINKEVVGVKNLTVTANKTQVLAGFAEDIEVTVKDATGNAVTGLGAANFSINGGSALADGVSVKAGTTNTYVISKAKFDNNVDSNNKAEDQVINVKDNTIGQNYNAVTVSTVLPKVTVSGDNNLTAGIKEAKTITIADPRNADALIKGDIAVAAKNNASGIPTVTGATIQETVDSVDGALTSNKDTYALKLFALDNTAITDASVLVVKVNNVEVTNIDVVGAKLSAGDVEDIYLGVPNKLALTLTDAHNKGIADKEIKYAGNVIGTTDADGKVTVTITPNASGTALLTESANLAQLKLDVVDPTADSKFVKDDYVKNEDGITVAVKNNGLGVDTNLKVVVKDDANKTLGFTYLSELKGGATDVASIKFATTKLVNKKTGTKRVYSYTKKVYSTQKGYSAIKGKVYSVKVKVKGKYVTKKYKKVAVYKTVDVYSKVSVPVTGTVQLVKGTTVVDSFDL